MSSDSIKVVCRLRPLNKIQIANNGEECVTHTSKEMTIKVQPPSSRQDNRVNIALPLIKYLDLTLSKFKYIKKQHCQSSKPSLQALTGLFLLMDRQAEARHGRCRYLIVDVGTQPSRCLVQRSDSSNNRGPFRFNILIRREHLVCNKVFLYRDL